MTRDVKTGAIDPPTVFVVDDDPQVREALSLLLDSMDMNVETFPSAQAFLQSFDPARPGCLVLDIRMPGMSGLELQQELIARSIHIPILLLTAHAEVPIAVDALKAGALDFIEKPYSPQRLLDRIQDALAQDARLQEEHLKLADIKVRLERLSEREQQVMQFLVDGRSTLFTSGRLEISEKTVDFHRRNLLEKMQVDTVVELARLVEFVKHSKTADGSK